MRRFGGGGGPAAPGAVEARPAAALGVWLLLAPLLMFFLSLVSAFLVRRGIAGGWGSFPLPGIVWANTALLLASSVTAELARRRPAGAWLPLTFALGLVFLGGQVLAWRALQADGIAIGDTPFGSYFYLMTGAHAAHLLGGLVALAAALAWPRGATPAAARRPRVLSGSVVYWHFLTAVWLGLVLLLAEGR